MGRRAPAGPRLVSVVINNYNYGRFLRDAIDSALAQTYEPLEVIVVDDGSTDDSPEVIASYGERVHAILKPNGGQGSAFNAGFAAARGELILFLDADDMLLPTAVERGVERFAEPGIVKVHWPLDEIDALGRRTGGTQPPYPLAEGSLKRRSVVEGPLAGDAPPTSGNLWSRALLERVLPLPEEKYRINADGYLVMLSWIYGKVRTIGEPLSLYRVHGSNHYVAHAEERKQQVYLDHFVRHCDDLALHLTRAGKEVDVEDWKIKKGLGSWEARVAAARHELRGILPRHSRFLLVDEDGWGETRIHGRRAIPFPERDGAWAGRPPDDASALQELLRVWAGADFIVFTWHTRSWLQLYPQLAAYLRARCPAVDAFHVTTFDLRWSQRVHAARERMCAAIPSGARYVLVDENALSNFGATELLAGRAGMRFQERDGVYQGKPADDRAAIAELERLRSAGAEFILFPWFCVWWLEWYPGLAAHLESTARCLERGEHLAAFDLRTS